MKTEQAQAIINYLEFHLLAYVEETEQHVHDPEIIGDMYDRAYKVLNDFALTLETQTLLDYPHPLTSNKK